MSAIRDITSIDLSSMNTLQGTLDALAICTALTDLNLRNCYMLTGSAMALVACTQLKELNLGNTKLTGEWCVVGIDRAPVPSEQRSNERAVAHQNY